MNEPGAVRIDPSDDARAAEPAARHAIGAAVAVYAAGIVGAVVLLSLALAAGVVERVDVPPRTAVRMKGLAPVWIGFAGQWVCSLAAYAVVRSRVAVAARAVMSDRSLRRVRPRDLWYVLLGIVLQFALTIPYVLVFRVDRKRLDAPARELADRAGGLGLGFVGLCVMTVVLAPLLEEWFFRWVAHGAIRLAVPGAAAVVLSSAWFGGAHFEWLQFPALFGFGVAAAVVRDREQRYVPSVLLHAGFNAIAMAALAAKISS